MVKQVALFITLAGTFVTYLAIGDFMAASLAWIWCTITAILHDMREQSDAIAVLRLEVAKLQDTTVNLDDRQCANDVRINILKKTLSNSTVVIPVETKEQ